MLLLGSRLIGTPVMSLQTGTRLAETKRALIDPSNLKLVAYELDGPMLVERPSYVRIADVRELSGIGMIVDSSDEFIGADDVIAIKNLNDLGFVLDGMTVIDEMKHKLGKVEDYSIDTDSFIIQQLTIKRGVLKSLTDTALLVHRSQILEINDKNIVVRATAKKLESIEKETRLSYINPFRTPSPQVETVDAGINPQSSSSD
jgi:uncharacterized protein YrrD